MNVIAYKPPFGQLKVYEVGPPKSDLSVSSEAIIEGCPTAFAIGPFDPSQKAAYYPVVREIDVLPSNLIAENYCSHSFRIPTRKQYIEYIKSIINILKDNRHHKIVASRRVEIPFLKKDESYMYEMLTKLSREHKDAYVFLISTAEWGTWIGASPELLLKKKGRRLRTVSLAGTRSYGSDIPWDKKNKEEQAIVTRHIISVFEELGIMTKTGKPETRKAGKIEHLQTTIQGEMTEGVELKMEITEGLLHSLSPTPALSGFPRETALKAIEKFEGDRLLYGGYFGPVFKAKNRFDFTYNVILRCACLGPATAVLFAGGGILSDSNPAEEWEETEKKLLTLLPYLSCNNKAPSKF